MYIFPPNYQGIIKTFRLSERVKSETQGDRDRRPGWIRSGYPSNYFWVPGRNWGPIFFPLYIKFLRIQSSIYDLIGQLEQHENDS